ncbi:MAG TPA: aldolase [Methanoregulaceae archaeon]|nr:aldolase [Methanoregulaceae archaeon]HQJ87150.1 aldolase [Methanoregulaceae archaeon]
MAAKQVFVPCDVPPKARETYIENYRLVTRDSGRLMLFAGDQKVEHLNDDFFGEGIHEDDADPEHLFRIASQGRIGVFATQFGLIARYGMDYPDVPYLVKLNSKTHLVKTAQADPLSGALWSVKQVVKFRDRTGLKIAGVGYTIYLGSAFEAQMLREAAEAICEAHNHGLLVVLWIYPRGAAVKDEKDPHLIAGAAGVASALGADFVKVNAPKREGFNSAELLREATRAAGRTKVVCAGGSSTDEKKFLQGLYDQIHTGGASGNATGRNIHQKSLAAAVAMCNAIYAITVENRTVDEAVALLAEPCQ